MKNTQIQSPTHPNSLPRAGLRKRLFARMMASTSGDEYFAEHRRQLISGLGGDVLEIGPGTGPNLVYYRPGVHWLGIEPNPAMHSYLRAEAERLGLAVDLRLGSAEDLPVPSASQDVVVATHVLCSVGDVAATLSEARRVLRPGGKLIFMEHVAAPRGSGLRRWQSFLQPLWSFVADNCHPDRETWAYIEQAGFQDVQIDHFDIPIWPMGPQIAGVAVK
jgi:SAM-dependent methyltransferase